MKHAIILFHGISYTAGLIAMGLALLAYVRFRNSLMRSYFVFMIALTGLLVQQTVTIYQTVNKLEDSSMSVLLRAIDTISSGLIIYALPGLILGLLGRGLTKKQHLQWLTLGSASTLLLLLYYMTSYKAYILAVMNSILYLTILYCLYTAFRNLDRLKTGRLGKVLKSYLYLTLISFPYLYLDSKTEYIIPYSRYFPYGLFSVPVFYLLWNLLSLYHGIRYFSELEAISRKSAEKQQEGIDPEQAAVVFFEKYGITSREKEIIVLLKNGCSYEQIAKALVISMPTVKTHVHNIYQKAGVSSKMALVNLMQQVRQDENKSLEGSDI